MIQKLFVTVFWREEKYNAPKRKRTKYLGKTRSINGCLHSGPECKQPFMDLFSGIFIYNANQPTSLTMTGAYSTLSVDKVVNRKRK